MAKPWYSVQTIASRSISSNKLCDGVLHLAGSFRSFCSLEEGEQDLVKEIEIKYDHQDITKREPLLHLAVRTGNLAVVEVHLLKN
jgi:hypothetical protein